MKWALAGIPILMKKGTDAAVPLITSASIVTITGMSIATTKVTDAITGIRMDALAVSTKRRKKMGK